MDTEGAHSTLSDTSRIKGFSDGVFAVIITITVLEIHAPSTSTVQGLLAIAPLLLTYVLSFTNLGVYWNNHHHLLYNLKQVKGPIMWANLLLLFFLSLIPFSTSWIGNNPDQVVPVVTYGVLLLLCAISYTVLQQTILSYEGKDSLLRQAIGKDTKGKISLAVLLAGIAIGFFFPLVSYIFYIAIVCIWIIPDTRLESVLGD